MELLVIFRTTTHQESYQLPIRYCFHRLPSPCRPGSHVTIYSSRVCIQAIRLVKHSVDEFKDRRQDNNILHVSVCRFKSSSWCVTLNLPPNWQSRGCFVPDALMTGCRSDREERRETMEGSMIHVFPHTAHCLWLRLYWGNDVVPQHRI